VFQRNLAEDGDSMFLKNSVIYIQINTDLQTRRPTLTIENISDATSFYYYWNLVLMISKNKSLLVSCSSLTLTLINRLKCPVNQHLNVLLA
jgi:hypothetical protein